MGELESLLNMCFWFVHYMRGKGVASLFQGVGEDVGGWSGVEKMRVVLGFSNEKRREVVEQVKIFLVKLWEKRRFLGA